MSVEKAFYALLSQEAAISGLVGSHIYPLRAPEDIVAPFIVYQKISGIRWRSLGGPSGMAQTRIQIDAYAASYAGAKTLAESIRIALDGYRGTVLGVRIGAVTLENDQDLLEEDIDPVLHRVTMDFMVTHEE